MAVLAALFVIAVFFALVALVVRLSGRRYPGDITGPQGNEIDYDDPYPGWKIWTNDHPAPRREPRPAPDDFEKWESEHWPGREQ